MYDSTATANRAAALRAIHAALAQDAARQVARRVEEGWPFADAVGVVVWFEHRRRFDGGDGGVVRHDPLVLDLLERLDYFVVPDLALGQR